MARKRSRSRSGSPKGSRSRSSSGGGKSMVTAANAFKGLVAAGATAAAAYGGRKIYKKLMRRYRSAEHGLDQGTKITKKEAVEVNNAIKEATDAQKKQRGRWHGAVEGIGKGEALWEASRLKNRALRYGDVRLQGVVPTSARGRLLHLTGRMPRDMSIKKGYTDLKTVPKLTKGYKDAFLAERVKAGKLDPAMLADPSKYVSKFDKLPKFMKDKVDPTVPEEEGMWKRWFGGGKKETKKSEQRRSRSRRRRSRSRRSRSRRRRSHSRRRSRSRR